MPRTEYYDPIVESGATRQATPIRGFPVTIGGTYVLLDDVITVLREYAQSLVDPDQGLVVHEVATWLQSGAQEVLEPQESTLRPSDDVEPEPIETYLTPDVDRVELFPTESAEGGARKWHARSIDTSGNEMKRTAGSFDKAYVERDIFDRWPGVSVYEVQDEGESSMERERGKRGFRRQLWAAPCE